MVLKEVLLVLESSSDALVGVDVTLASVHDGNVSEAKGDDTTSEDVDDVSTLVPVGHTFSQLQETCAKPAIHT